MEALVIGSSCSCSSLTYAFSKPSPITKLSRKPLVVRYRHRYNPPLLWVKPTNASSQSQQIQEVEEEEEEEYKVVTSLKTSYNEIMIIDTHDSRLLLLDSSHFIHSIFQKGQKWTNSYWDEFASLPAVVPEGPIAMLGLAGGTAAHLMLDLWPSLQLHGWEIDGILIDKAREFLGMSDLETPTEHGGVLHVHVGDALSPSVTVPGGFAGIIVDMSSDGKILPQLEEVETWLELANRLMPNGRIMVNCCGAPDSNDGTWVQNSTIKALCTAFPGQLSWKKVEGENYVALTGPLPDLNSWAAALPSPLSTSVTRWKPCSSSSSSSSSS